MTRMQVESGSPYEKLYGFSRGLQSYLSSINITSGVSNDSTALEHVDSIAGRSVDGDDDLKDLHDVTQMLGIYNADLPAINDIGDCEAEQFYDATLIRATQLWRDPPVKNL